MSSFPAHVFVVVKKIPRGRVATYGDVAALAGNARAAREVGWALHTLVPGSRIPWWRVVNRLGRISLQGFVGQDQAERLRKEGIAVSEDGALDLDAARWRPRTAARLASTPAKTKARRTKPAN